MSLADELLADFESEADADLAAEPEMVVADAGLGGATGAGAGGGYSGKSVRAIAKLYHSTFVCPFAYTFLSSMGCISFLICWPTMHLPSAGQPRPTCHSPAVFPNGYHQPKMSVTPTKC